MTILPRDLLPAIYDVTVSTREHDRGAVLPDACERVAAVSVTDERVRVVLERDRGHGPDRGVRVVTLARVVNGLTGLPMPGFWQIASDRFVSTPEPIQSAGASRRRLSWRDRVNVASPRGGGIY